MSDYRRPLEPKRNQGDLFGMVREDARRLARKARFAGDLTGPQKQAIALGRHPTGALGRHPTGFALPGRGTVAALGRCGQCTHLVGRGGDNRCLELLEKDKDLGDSLSGRLRLSWPACERFERAL